MTLDNPVIIGSLAGTPDKPVFLGSLSGAGTGGGVTDHGALTGLSDDDHTQYVLSAGRAGGQTVNGGTNAGDDFTLSSNGSGTKGTIFIGTDLIVDEAATIFTDIFWGNFSSHLYLTKSYTSFPTDTELGLYNFMELDPTNDVTIQVNATTLGLQTKPGNTKSFRFLVGCETDVYHAGSGDVTELYGIIGTVISFGGGNTGTQVGCQYSSLIENTSTCDLNIGTRIESGTLGAGGSVGSNYGLYIALSIGALPITNNYGLYIGDHSAQGSVDSFNFYSDGAAAKNYFGGHVLIGTKLPPTTGTAGLIFGDGTALATMASNTAGFYANDIAGNVSMHVINENGDIIKLIKTGTYTPSNVTTDRSYDANATSVDELADVLGTLIADLQLTGLIV